MAELELEVFRVGDYGDKGCYGESDLDELVADYDPSMHEAPVTVDHARSGPAYGWVKGVKRVGDRLVATLKDLGDDFVSLLKKGAFKKRSIELYRKFSGTGRPYLRAVSFLGAQPPEVKGLADPVFEEEGEFVDIAFDEGLPECPESFEESEIPESPENHEQEESGEDATVLMAERNRLLEEVETLRKENRRQKVISFCDDLKRRGRILPAWEKKGLVEFLLKIDSDDTVCFGEEKCSPMQWFLKFLEEMPPQVRLEEVAAENPATPSFDEGYPRESDKAAVSPESVEIHRRVIAFREAHPGVSYVEALGKVMRETMNPASSSASG